MNDVHRSTANLQQTAPPCIEWQPDVLRNVDEQVAAPAAAEREVLRCEYCSLNQFVTADRHCRRCRRSLDPAPPAPALPIGPLPRLRLDPRNWDRPVVVDVAHALRVLRLRAGFTQGSLGCRMNAKTRMEQRARRTYLSKIENGRCTPTLRGFTCLAKALGVSAADFAHLCAPPADSLFGDPFVLELYAYTNKLDAQQFAFVLQRIEARLKEIGAEQPAAEGAA